MNWFRENPFWSAFIAIAGGALSSARVSFGGRKAALKMRWRNIEIPLPNRPVGKRQPVSSAANVSNEKRISTITKAALDKLKAELKHTC